MPRYLIIALLFLALVAASAFASDKSSGESGGVHGGGLMCFSITPPHDRETSCDQLCAAKDAICVGLKTSGAMNPGIGCADVTNAKFYGDYIASCRCCALDHR
jgi:hypothetical protein